MFDLNQCKVGDRLVNRMGKLCFYTGKDIEGFTTATYPHAVCDENRGGIYRYTADGRFFCRQEDKWDIVGFAAKPKPKRIREAKPVNKLLGLLEYVQEQGSNVDTWYAPDYIYGAFDKGGKHFYYGYEYKTLPYKAYIGLGNSKRHTVHTLNNFKGAVTKLLKGAK
jgi:hypothetical protein